MDIKTESMALTIVSALYEGGVEQFGKDGGNVICIGHPSKDIIVFHTDLPEKVVTPLLNLSKAGKVNVSIMKTPNFQGMDSEQIKETCTHIIKFFNVVMPNASFFRAEVSNLMIISIPTVSSKDLDDLDLVVEFLKKIRGLEMSYLVLKDKAIKVETTLVESTKVVTERGKITDDDILNLRISLENAQTVEDILNCIQ